MSDQALNAYLESLDQPPEEIVEVEKGYLEYLEQQIETLQGLAIPIARIIKPGRHRLAIIIDEETSDREKDDLIAFYEEFGRTREDDAGK